MASPRKTHRTESDDVAGTPSLAHPHDALFRHAFGRPEHAAGEFAYVLGAELARHLDFGSLELVSGTHVDEVLRKSESDLLYSVRLAGRDARMFILIEHQSSDEPHMLLRLLRYMHAIWMRGPGEGHSREGGLPPILAVVLHHGPRAWSEPLRFSSLFALGDEVRAAFSAHLVDFGFTLDDLSRLEPADLKSRTTLTPFARLVLLLLMRARTSPDLVADLAGFASDIRALARTAAGRRDLRVAFRYAVTVGDPPLEDLRRLVRETAGPRLEEDIVTTAERLIAEGEAKGRAAGRVETIARQLRLKFGPISDDVSRRLGSASIDDLDRFAERILFAATIDEVFAG